MFRIDVLLSIMDLFNETNKEANKEKTNELGLNLIKRILKVFLQGT